MKKQFVQRQCRLFDIDEIVQACSVSRYTASVLATRQIRSAQEAYRFMYPSYDLLSDPANMYNCKEIVNYLKELDKASNIIIVGDYDVDGVCGSYILHKGLNLYGFHNITVRIPLRSEGYGFSKTMAESIVQSHADLVLTVDNGIASKDAIDYCAANGIPTIVFDHHEIPTTQDGTYILPNARYIMDPCLMAERSTESLCGAGVAYYMLRLLLDDSEELREELLPFVALATVCDVVPLYYDNRVLVNDGIRLLTQQRNIGLSTLFSVQSVDINNVSTYDLGFRVGPCINAAGRIANASQALELFYARDKAEALPIATKLQELNIERQGLSEKGRQIAEMQLDHSDTFHVCLLDSSYVPVAGIIAGNITKLYHKPCVVLCGTEDDEAIKGSGRSIEEFELYKALKDYPNFISFGGHKMACGCTMPGSKFHEFKEYCQAVSTSLSKDPVVTIYYDTELKVKDVTLGLVQELHALGPFGCQSPSPYFLLRDVTVSHLRRIGKEGQYMSFKVDDLKCLMWQDCDELVDLLEANYSSETIDQFYLGLKGFKADIVGELNINEWNHVKTAQLVVKGIIPK